MKTEIRSATSPIDSKEYDTGRLRAEYLIQDLFSRELHMCYTHNDRMIVGGVAPSEPVSLRCGDIVAADYFCERREIGVLNLGGEGRIVCDGKPFVLRHRDGLYIGKGTKEVLFESAEKGNPAKFYFNSAPAHHTYPTVLICPDGQKSEDRVVVSDENKLALGEDVSSNKRTICKYIIPGQVDSCQLCMGITTLEPGSVWNSMPCHTHDRRMEVYLYFDLDEREMVVHLMGEGTETRHIMVHNEEAVISPSWSIHAGCGTSSYAFVWGMCGENQTFNDMDGIATADLR